jgi:hypothetical protein
VRRVLLPLRPIDLEQQLAAAGGPAGANPRDQDGDGKDDETGEPVKPEGEESGDEQADEDAGEMTVAKCLELRPDLEPLLRAATGNNEGALASIKSLLVSGVPAQFSSMVPAECRQ